MGLVNNIIYSVREILNAHSNLEELIQNIEKGNLSIKKNIISNKAGLPNNYYNNVLDRFKKIYRENREVYNITIGIYYFFNRKKRNEFNRGVINLLEKS